MNEHISILKVSIDSIHTTKSRNYRKVSPEM